MVAQVLVLFIAWASAVFGIWTQRQRNNTVAAISTGITTVGLLAGMSLARQQSTNAKRKRENDLRTILAGTELIQVEIEWAFDNVPTQVLAVFSLGELIENSNFLSDDELDRSPQEIRQVASRSWHIDNVVIPLIASISNGATDARSLYTGEVEKSIVKWESDHSEIKNPDELWFHVEYSGPTYELVFPLNPQLNAAVSLGKKSDDQVLDAAKYVWQEDFPHLFEITNYGFESCAECEDGGFKLRWKYDHASLLRAVEASGGTKVTAGFSKEFSFVIVQRPLERSEYLTKVYHQFKTEQESHVGEANTWDSKSTLTLYVNGIRETPVRVRGKQGGSFFL